jgi:hypothetical protein
MPDNDFYGHRTALARYCGLRQSSPAVFGSIRHGWQPDLGEIGERRIPSAPIFVWNRREQDEAARRGIPNVIAIGAPFLYAASTLAAGDGGPPVGAGTIVFPLHSGGMTHTSQDHGQLIEQVEAEEQGPFTVSVFYQDLHRPEVVEPFRRAGWRRVSFGSRDDPLFLTRLVLELAAHRAVVSDLVSSAVWYGAHLGRRVRLMGPTPQIVRRSGSDPQLERYERWPQLREPGVEGEAATALAAVELGADCMRSPDELAALLGWRSWHRYAAPVVRLAIDARHGNDLRRGRPLPRSVRSTPSTPSTPSPGAD